MKRWLGIALLAVGLAVFCTSTVRAHGSAGQETFLRLQTVAFWNFTLSPTTLKVGEELTLTGKFKVLETWPVDILGSPDLAYLTIGGPGPQVLLKECWIGGVFVPGSFFPKLGHVYEYRLVGVARTEGKHHLHPKMNFAGAGPLLGPGEWVTIEPGSGPFTMPVTLMNGQTIDLERYGTGRVIGWHLITFALGAAWLAYWLAKPLLARVPAAQAGEYLITGRDHRVALVFIGMSAAVLIAGYLNTAANYDDPIPLQINRVESVPVVESPRFVEVIAKGTKYNLQTRTLTIDIQGTNTSDKSVELLQLVAAHLTFKNKALEPEAAHTMVVEPGEPIKAGETKTLRLTIQDPVWEQERMHLIPIREVQTVMAGMVDFADPDGRHTYVTFGSRVLPDRVLPGGAGARSDDFSR